MQPSNTHLSVERLAAFDAHASGETPFSADEQAHLAACAVCRGDLETMMSIVALAGALGTTDPDTAAPRLVEFDTIAAGLRAEQVVSAPASSAPQASPTASARPLPLRTQVAMGRALPMLRRAAAVLLLAGGGAVLGRVTATGPAFASPFATVAAAGTSDVSVRPVALGNTGIGADSDAPFADRSYATIDEASAALNRAQREYERASLWLASNDTTVRDPEVFRARLAALDQMMEASRMALRDAPQDPVLNHYYLAAYSAREATLQALGGVLPVDKIIERY